MLDIIADIDGQIYARDFKLIDQADMIVSLDPRAGRRQAGPVQRRRARAAARPRGHQGRLRDLAAEDEPSPFITETATKVFRTVDEAVAYFFEFGYATEKPEGTLFG